MTRRDDRERTPPQSGDAWVVALKVLGEPVEFAAVVSLDGQFLLKDAAVVGRGVPAASPRILAARRIWPED